MTDPTIGAVIIGRNEGERLVRCLASVQGLERIVYVDSGSTDGSVAAAREAGAEVAELDLTLPFTAARARNAGVEVLRTGNVPDLIQFIDGDCELQPGWLHAATTFLAENPKAAVACGRRRERFPEVSVYNYLCDREWDTPVGRAKACGGDSLMLMAALDEVGGFDPHLIAGEEPELCTRLRGRGWEVWRLDEEMTLHDAAITQFSQWWKRARRSGHAAAEGMVKHGIAPERHGVDQVRRAVAWGAVLPLAIAVGALFGSPCTLVLLFAYPAQIVRLRISRNDWVVASFLTLSKFPEAIGVAEYWLNRLSGQRSRLIEYK